MSAEETTFPPDTDEQAEDSADERDDLQFDNLPNRLTLLRIILVPVVVGLVFLRDPFWDVIATVIFGAASITDYFDGYYARARKIVTVYGKLLDPLADKFLVVSTLIMLEHLGRIHPVLVILLICRELAITGLRALASAEGVIIAASDSAKWKTASQMVAIPCLMIEGGLWSIPTFQIGQGLIYMSLAISLWSAKDYVIGFFRALGEKRRLRTEERRRRKAEKRLAKLARKGETS